ncbi:MAG: DUF4843 domain-containing protein [Niabella sp.]
MKLIYTIILLFFSILTMMSCKEDDLMLFDQETSGSNVYFPDVVTTNDTVFKLVSFGYEGLNKTDSVIGIPIQITGNAADFDREVKMAYDTGTTAIEGVHFDYLRKPIIRAGRILDTILLDIHRTEDMVDQQLKLAFKLEPNQYFNTNLPGNITSTKNLSYLNYNIYMNDIAGVSYLWTTFGGKSLIVLYFGEYSRTKVDLMIEVLKVNPGYFYDPTIRIGAGQVIGWASYMKWWLTEQENAGIIYYDENGVKITMGPAAR